MSPAAGAVPPSPSAVDLRGTSEGGLRPRCRDLRGIVRVASAVAAEIQAWIDRETVVRLVAALRRSDAAAARALLWELEAHLLSAGGFDPQLQRALLQHAFDGES